MFQFLIFYILFYKALVIFNLCYPFQGPFAAKIGLDFIMSYLYNFISFPIFLLNIPIYYYFIVKNKSTKNVRGFLQLPLFFSKCGDQLITLFSSILCPGCKNMVAPSLNNSTFCFRYKFQFLQISQDLLFSLSQ